MNELSQTSGPHISEHALIYRGVSIGNDNWVGPYVVIGSPGEFKQTKHFQDNDHESNSSNSVIIGHRNVVREFTSIQAGISKPTRIGNDCYIMNKAYIPHDAVIGNGVTLSAGTLIGGYSVIGDKAYLGLGSILHQHSVIGYGSMIGMGSVVKGYVPPFAMVYGVPGKIRGVNRVLLEKLNVDSNLIRDCDFAIQNGDLSWYSDIAKYDKDFKQSS